ncbi:MAG: hypothetical protein AAF678_10025 [Pseudomonadota bacterium]
MRANGAKGRLFGALFGTAATVACSSDVPFALQNERLFFFDFNRGEISGQYNPAGFSSDEVQRVAEWLCDRGRLGDITETELENGLTDVAVPCRTSNITGQGRAEIRRRASGDLFDVVYRGTTQHGRILRKRTF